MKQDEKQIMDELKREYESIPVPPQARADHAGNQPGKKRTETR